MFQQQHQQEAVKIRPLGGWKFAGRFIDGYYNEKVKIRPLGGWKCKSFGRCSYPTGKLKSDLLEDGNNYDLDLKLTADNLLKSDLLEDGN